MDQLTPFFSSILGLELEQDQLSAWHMGARAGVVYLLAIALVHLGEKRFIGKSTAFDVILGIMLGSILSRGITGSSLFWPTLVAATVLVALHYLIAAYAFHSDRFGSLVKGNPRILVKDGEIDWEAMRRSHISRKDLMCALRENGSTEDVSRVRLACLERSGNISVLTKSDE